MMPPAPTGCPPYTFTPRRLDTESRPFFVEPAPFLCAASMGATAGLKRAGAGRAARGRSRAVLQRQPSCKPVKELTSASAIPAERLPAVWITFTATGALMGHLKEPFRVLTGSFKYP